MIITDTFSPDEAPQIIDPIEPGELSSEDEAYLEKCFGVEGDSDAD